MKSGYSYQTLLDNAATLGHQGVPRKNALAASFAYARLSYFKRFPGGWLPKKLQRPQGYGNKSDYNLRGYPIQRGEPMTLNNPSVRDAITLQKRFSGSFSRIEKVTIPPNPRAALVVGPLTMIGYQSTRDGSPAIYVHRFAKHARPLLAASNDGQHLLILGGEFAFTERGIVDHPRNRKR